MTAAVLTEHKCVFVEEEEPSGRLILPPCLVCGTTALDALDQLRTVDKQLPSIVESTPWVWQGGYPQRITNPASVLIAEVFENPDAPAVIAPLICDAVNVYIGATAENLELLIVDYIRALEPWAESRGLAVHLSAALLGKRDAL